MGRATPDYIATHLTRQTSTECLHERFNQTFREDMLDANLFSSLYEEREIAEEWLEEYNAIRPHQALMGLTPYQFATQST